MVYGESHLKVWQKSLLCLPFGIRWYCSYKTIYHTRVENAKKEEKVSWYTAPWVGCELFDQMLPAKSEGKKEENKLARERTRITTLYKDNWLFGTKPLYIVSWLPAKMVITSWEWQCSLILKFQRAIKRSDKKKGKSLSTRMNQLPSIATKLMPPPPRWGVSPLQVAPPPPPLAFCPVAQLSSSSCLPAPIYTHA